MVAYLLQRDLPALYRVAAFTVRAKLAAVDVGMAVGAMGAHILEDQTGMALGAGDLLMHAAQWVACVVVIELGIRPDGLPTGVTVALLAGNGDGAVRVGYLGLRSSDTGPRTVARLLRDCRNKQGYQSNDKYSDPACRSHQLLREFQCLESGYDLEPPPPACSITLLPRALMSLREITLPAQTSEVGELVQFGVHNLKRAGTRAADVDLSGNM